MELAWLIRGAVLLVVILLVDRILLRIESRGWINYRRNGLSRGGALYHTLELHGVFHPGMQQVIEVRYGEKKQQDDSGAPPTM